MDVQIIDDCHGYLVEWRYCKGLAAYVATMTHNGAIYWVVSEPTKGTMVSECVKFATGDGAIERGEVEN